ncbi:MAG: sensor histidine kinase, partial [Cyclobacteriaceae bacterium]
MRFLVLSFFMLLSISASSQQLYVDSLLQVPADSAQLSTKAWYWTSVTINSETDYLEFAGWGTVIAYGEGLTLKSGVLLKADDKDYYSYQNIIPVKGQSKLLIKLKGEHPLFDLRNLGFTYYSSEEWRLSERKRLLVHGLFFGIVIVMALYNLMIFFAVKDQSYIWYVLSIVGFGLYMAFYYGFTYEYFWPDHPHWNAHFFAFIIPVTNISRILFTKSYLHTSEYVAKWNIFFNGLLIAYSIPLVLWMTSWLSLTDLLSEANYIIGFIGSVTMISITVVSLIVYLRGYKPALWFLVAFGLFNVGGILFIFRELNYLEANFITRYGVQIGTVAQVVLFSFGLSDRLNRTRKKLAQRTIEKEKIEREREKEKKEIAQKRKDQLEVLIRERTGELEKTLEQLKISEHELRELNDLKTKLFSIISHELKSPLTTVDSYLNLLINHYDKLSSTDFSDLSNKTKFSLQNLTLLLDNLLLWTRLQQNSITYQPVRVDLRRAVDKSVKLFHLLFEQKQIKLVVEPEVDEIIAICDKDMAEFIFRNLLHNALKFTPKKGTITIAATVFEQYSWIFIKDTGVGMSPELIRKILEDNVSYTRLGTEEEKGTGIGLLMCKDFIEKNGGILEIKAEKGTVVSFSVPTSEIEVADSTVG